MLLLKKTHLEASTVYMRSSVWPYAHRSVCWSAYSNFHMLRECQEVEMCNKTFISQLNKLPW